MRRFLVSISAALALVVATSISRADPPDFQFNHGQAHQNRPGAYYRGNDGPRFQSYYNVRPFAGPFPYQQYHSFTWHGRSARAFYWNPNNNRYSYGNDYTNFINNPSLMQPNPP